MWFIVISLRVGQTNSKSPKGCRTGSIDHYYWTGFYFSIFCGCYQYVFVLCLFEDTVPAGTPRLCSIQMAFLWDFMDIYWIRHLPLQTALGVSAEVFGSGWRCCWRRNPNFFLRKFWHCQSICFTLHKCWRCKPQCFLFPFFLTF